MINTKAQARYTEIVEGTFTDKDGTIYYVDRDGCIVRSNKQKAQVKAATKSAYSAWKKMQ